MMDGLVQILTWLGLLPQQNVFYIGGSDILPPPLKGKEEQDALEALEQGDESAKQLLIERNLRLVVFIARRFEKYRRKSGRPDLHWHHRADQSGGNLPPG